MVQSQDGPANKSTRNYPHLVTCQRSPLCEVGKSIFLSDLTRSAGAGSLLEAWWLDNSMGVSSALTYLWLGKGGMEKNMEQLLRYWAVCKGYYRDQLFHSLLTRGKLVKLSESLAVSGMPDRSCSVY